MIVIRTSKGEFTINHGDLFDNKVVDINSVSNVSISDNADVTEVAPADESSAPADTSDGTDN